VSLEVDPGVLQGGILAYPGYLSIQQPLMARTPTFGIDHKNSAIQVMSCAYDEGDHLRIAQVMVSS
jgi:hypothetical protein